MDFHRSDIGQSRIISANLQNHCLNPGNAPASDHTAAVDQINAYEFKKSP